MPVARRKVHCDPGTLLVFQYLPNDDDVRFVFLRSLSSLAKMFRESSDCLELVLCCAHHNALMVQHCSELSRSSGGRVIDLHRVLIRFWATIRPYKEMDEESGGAVHLVGLKENHLPPIDSDEFKDWRKFLSSDALLDCGKIAPFYCTAFSVIDGDSLAVDTAGKTRHYPVVKSRPDLFEHLNIPDPKLLPTLQIGDKTEFRWEKTGHGATAHQRKVIEDVARHSGIVTRSQTTYQNPQGGKRNQPLTRTGNPSDFKFSVPDGDNILEGIFFTNAETVEQSKTAFIVLRKSFRDLYGL